MITVIGGGGRGWFSLDATGLGLDEGWWYQEVVPQSAAADISSVPLTATAADGSASSHDEGR